MNHYYYLSLNFILNFLCLFFIRYANRAKNIKNKAKINEDPKDALLRQFQSEIEKLKQQLSEGKLGALSMNKQNIHFNQCFYTNYVFCIKHISGYICYKELNLTESVCFFNDIECSSIVML